MKVIINNAEMVPTTTPDKGPLQFEIDEQLNTTWYKE